MTRCRKRIESVSIICLQVCKYALLFLLPNKISWLPQDLFFQSTCINNLWFFQDSSLAMANWVLEILFPPIFSSQSWMKDCVVYNLFPQSHSESIDSDLHWRHDCGRLLCFFLSRRTIVPVLLSCHNLWTTYKMASLKGTSKFAWKSSSRLELLNCSLSGCYKQNSVLHKIRS